ncbi:MULTISPECIES: UPF0146 family protein [unclassified Haladaptatus]|uniref:UPF0146 family protein n=1 Tax=unclassified Haladaptatus TaxID=2622732 RepID=UPI002FCE5AFB
MDNSTEALVSRLSRYDRLVEVGIGRRTDVAAGLVASGKDVTAVDIDDVPVPDGVTFVRDDITNPGLGVYDTAECIYALNCPPDLQGAVAEVAKRVGADFYFTTLGTDPAVIPAKPEMLPGDTLFRALERGRTRYD